MIRKQRKEMTKETFDIIGTRMKSEKFSIKTISEDLQINRNTVGKIVKMHENGQPFISSSTKRKKTCKAKNETFSAIEQTLFNTIACNNALVQSELKTSIYESHQIELSNSTISRKLKKMKISRKRLSLIPEERNTSEKIDARAIYAADLSRVSDENLIFLDETGINEHCRRSYGYSAINTKAYLTVPANRGINKSIICAIGMNEIVAFDHKTGAYNSESFEAFIEKKLLPYFLSRPSKILVMDNARIHKSARILNFLRQKRIAYKFTVPYSPELNPIEEFFSMFKSRFHSLRVTYPKYKIDKCINQLLAPENNYGSQLQGFYRNMRRWLEKARRLEPFI